MRNILTDKDIIRVQKKIKKVYRSICKTSNGSDDCAQSIIQKFIEGKGQYQPIHFAVIDYLYLKNQTHDKLFDKKKDLDNILNYNGVDTSEMIYNSYECKNLLEQIDSKIDRAFYILFYKWGLSLSEIAECFDYSEAFISIKLKNIREIIKKRLKAQEL